jgi:hypothetical protein
MYGLMGTGTARSATIEMNSESNCFEFVGVSEKD